jgi:hypothetical protein
VEVLRAWPPFAFSAAIAEFSMIICAQHIRFCAIAALDEAAIKIVEVA